MRGVINNIARRQQINDFSGLILGRITPTDIDGVIEYKDKAYIFFEVKYKDTVLPYGQKLALQRLSDDVNKAGKKSIILIAQHDVQNTNDSIDVALCKVRNYYFKNKWLVPKSTITVIQAIEIFTKLL